jgi:excisionase family DNA binding protein
MKPRDMQFLDAPTKVATGDGENDHNRFLTVHEVATMLQVPVSWVYGRLRDRSSEPLPAYRVGKYWRFREQEIVAWVTRQKRGTHAA